MCGTTVGEIGLARLWTTHACLYNIEIPRLVAISDIPDIFFLRKATEAHTSAPTRLPSFLRLFKIQTKIRFLSTLPSLFLALTISCKQYAVTSPCSRDVPATQPGKLCSTCCAFRGRTDGSCSRFSTRAQTVQNQF